MKLREALEALGISPVELRKSPEKVKKRARQLLFRTHPDGGGTHKEFVRLNDAYTLLFKHTGRVDLEEDKSVEFKYTPPRKRRTVQLSDLAKIGDISNTDIVIEIPIKYGKLAFPTGSTKIYLAYRLGQRSYSKAMVLPKGTKTLVIEGEMYTIDSPARYQFNLDNLILNIDIHFE